MSTQMTLTREEVAEGLRSIMTVRWDDLSAGDLDAVEAAIALLSTDSEPRWIPWKPGDALPATAPVLHWTTWFDKEYTDVPMMRANHAHDFERWNVIAYWSAPLPPPYTPASTVPK